MGHFHTSWLGTAAQFASIGEVAPEVEQVAFAGKAPTYSFDIEHAGGMKAHVRAGLEDTGEVYKLGFIEVPKPGVMVGSVTSNGQLLGEIRFDDESAATDLAVAADEHRLGRIDCTVGNIEIVWRSEEPLDSDKPFSLTTGLAGLSGTFSRSITEYKWKGQVVATIDGAATGQVTFSPELPTEGQICIASAMAIRLAQDEFARQQRMANNLSATSRILAR